ncbi:THAP domain-containing protein 5 [Chionoecetes opilio]|uniref:THAP domain-containing protein 5 n=1 Tax=Chionoecetes opilio TaxID=41210 RepID=A0A8J4Y7B6_CHIOP|nr:THAP domain-containing protein 5 [Chionoecetes opilio]
MEHCGSLRLQKWAQEYFKKIGIKFHRFPKAERKTRNREWIRNTRWNNWTPSKRSVLCSDHFSASSFADRTNCKTPDPQLKPTIFTLPSHFWQGAERKEITIRSVLVEDLGNDLTVDCDVTPSSAPPENIVRLILIFPFSTCQIHPYLRPR